MSFIYARRWNVETDITQIVIAFIIAMTSLAGAVTAYVRRAIKQSDAARNVALEVERTERTNEIEAKQQRLAADLERERKQMEVRIVSEQSNSEQSQAMSQALATMATAFQELSKSITKSNQINDEWRQTFNEQHDTTLQNQFPATDFDGGDYQRRCRACQQSSCPLSAQTSSWVTVSRRTKFSSWLTAGRWQARCWMTPDLLASSRRGIPPRSRFIASTRTTATTAVTRTRKHG
jgi:hypothetical protein